MNTPILWPGAFPLRVVTIHAGMEYEIWTRHHGDSDNQRSNLPVCRGIQFGDEAEWICRTLNDAAEVERFLDTPETPGSSGCAGMLGGEENENVYYKNHTSYERTNLPERGQRG